MFTGICLITEWCFWKVSAKSRFVMSLTLWTQRGTANQLPIFMLTTTIGLIAFRGRCWKTRAWKSGNSHTSLSHGQRSAHFKFTLLYIHAEIEYFQNTCSSSDVLADDLLSAYIDSKAEWVSALGGFRNIFLHPGEDQPVSEVSFLNCQESYNLAPELQKHFDEYLTRAKLRILNILKDTLSTLPEVERAYCISGFIAHQSEEMVREIQDMDVLEFLVNSLEQMNKTLEKPTSWMPNQRQRQKALAIVGYLKDVSFSALLQPSNIERVAMQIPMSLTMLWPLIQGEPRPLYGSGRHSAYVEKHMPQYQRLLITVSVLINEILVGQAKENLAEAYTLAQLEESVVVAAAKMHEKFQTNPTSERGFQWANEWVTPSRVSVAILYEPLRMYAEIVKTNSSISNPRLDEWVAPKRLKHLRAYRRSVFHVVNRPERLDLTMTEPVFDPWNLFLGLSEFFRPKLIPKPQDLLDDLRSRKPS